MASERITADDVANWESLDAVADSLAKRGLVPRDDLGEDDEIVLELSDDQFLSIIEAGPTEDAKSFTSRMTYRRHTTCVATNDFDELDERVTSVV